MWEKLIKLCDKSIAKLDTQDSFNGFEGFITDFADMLPLYSVNSKNLLQYGRYLLHKDKNYNIQLDVFSMDYRGSIHSHGTWGVFGMIQGSMFVDDWANFNGEFRQTRKTFIARNTVQSFTAQSDWHRIRTQKHGDQPISIHIYGPSYDLDVGYALDENFKVVSYDRSVFKPNSLFKDKINEKN